MHTVWAQRREEGLRACLVSPDIFHHMVERLDEFVVPYQHVLETAACQHNVHLYLQGLLSPLPGKNAEDIATFVDIERQVLQAFIGTAPWDHRPLIEVLVPQVVHRLGQPDGILAFDPSSFPKRGTHSVGVKRQWCGLSDSNGEILVVKKRRRPLTRAYASAWSHVPSSVTS